MQETFDAAVQENIDEFEMEVSRSHHFWTIYRRMLRPRCNQQASVHDRNASVTIPLTYRSVT